MGKNRILNKLEDWAVKSTSLKAMIRGSKYSVCSCTSQGENRTTTWGQEQKKIYLVDLLLLCPSVDPSSMFRDDGLPRNSSKPESLKKSRPKKETHQMKLKSILGKFLIFFYVIVLMENIQKNFFVKLISRVFWHAFFEIFWRAVQRVVSTLGWRTLLLFRGKVSF